jgi:hypothetical protein
MPIHPALAALGQRPAGIALEVQPDLAKLAVQGAAQQLFGRSMRPNRQVLMDGKPITDAFSPQRR